MSFYRSRDLERQNGVLEEALEEIHPATLFYVDKLEGTALSRAFVYASENAEVLCARMDQELQLPATVLSVADFSGTQMDAGNRKMLQSFAPLVGLLVSRRVEFA